MPYLYRLLCPGAAGADGLRPTGAEPWLAGAGAAALSDAARLARPLGYGAGLAAALSMGDLGVIALFAGRSGATLPLFVQQLMGSYRMEQAAAAAAGAGGAELWVVLDL